MDAFPRTMVGGVSLPRLLIGTNWMLGYSHQTKAKNSFLKGFMTRERMTDCMVAFMEAGVDAMLSVPSEVVEEAVKAAEDRTGKKMIRILTPGFTVVDKGKEIHTSNLGAMSLEASLDRAKKLNATFALPHTSVTDRVIDTLHGELRGMDTYCRMIRERGMIPGLSTHTPESVVIADKTGLDVETYIQLYNAAGFLMHVEPDWVMRVIKNAKKPVMCIKPLAAGRLLPVVGLAFVWNTIRDQDMVAIGTTTPDEAREIVQISLDFLNRRVPNYELQTTRSKMTLE